MSLFWLGHEHKKTRIKSFVYIYVQSKRKANVSSQAHVVESNQMSVTSTQDFTCPSLGQSTVEKAENEKKTKVLNKGMISCAKFKENKCM